MVAAMLMFAGVPIRELGPFYKSGEHPLRLLHRVAVSETLIWDGTQHDHISLEGISQQLKTDYSDPKNGDHPFIQPHCTMIDNMSSWAISCSLPGTRDGQ